MELVNNLPVIIAAVFAIIAGLYGYLNGLPNSQVYWNMTLFLVVFYFIGLLLRRTIKGIVDENAEKAENVPVTEQLLYEGEWFANAGEGTTENSAEGDGEGATENGAEGEGEVAAVGTDSDEGGGDDNADADEDDGTPDDDGGGAYEDADGTNSS